MKPIAICVWQDYFIYHGFASRPHENKSSAPNCWTTPMDGWTFSCIRVNTRRQFFSFFISIPLGLLGRFFVQFQFPNQMPHNSSNQSNHPNKCVRGSSSNSFQKIIRIIFMYIEVVIFRYQWCNFSLQHAAEDFVQLCLSDGSVGDLLTRSCHRRTDGLA